MVFAVNSLLYLNQSVPPYGVSLNSMTVGTTAFPLRKWNRKHSYTLFSRSILCTSYAASYASPLCSPGMQEEVRLTLDCAQSDFIAYDKMVISLKGGEM